MKRLKRIWFYLKFGWKDQDNDYEYILELLRFKLKCMEDDFLWSDSLKKYQRQIKIARVLLDRLLKNDYLPDKLFDDLYYSDKYKDISAESLTRKKERLWLYSEYMEKQDWDYLFSLMKKKMKWWWY